MMNQLFSFPGRGNRCGGGCDRSPYRPRSSRGTGLGGCGCGQSPCSGGRLPTNRDMNPLGGARCACGHAPEVAPARSGSACRGTSPAVSHCADASATRPPCACKADVGQKKPCSDQSGSCGCGQKCNGNGISGGAESASVATCRKLMDQIRAVDFALYETVLYLDVYPHSCEALETYHKLKAQREELHRAYESTVGPLTAFGNESITSWDWMRKPFPWEYDAE